MPLTKICSLLASENNQNSLLILKMPHRSCTSLLRPPFLMPHLIKETLVNNMRKILTTLLKTLMTLFLRTSLCAAAPINTKFIDDGFTSEYAEEGTNVANGVIEVNGVRLQQSETVQNSNRDSRSFKMRFGDITNTPIDISFGNIMTGVNPHEVQNGAWSSYGPCSKICGGGMKERSCSKRVPGSRGSSCRGSARSSCNTQPCGGVSKREAIKTFNAAVQAVADGLCNVEESVGSKRYSWIHLFSEDEKKLLDILAEGTKYVQTACSSNEGNCQLKTMEGFVEMLATTFYKIKSTGKCSPGFGRYVGEMKTTFDLVAWVAEEYEAKGGNYRGLGLVNNEGFGTIKSGGLGTSNSEGWSLLNNGGSSAASSNVLDKLNYGGVGVTNNGGFGTTTSEGWSLQNNGGSSAASSNEFDKVNYGGVGVTNNGGFGITNSAGLGTSNSAGWSLLNNGGPSATSSNEFDKVNYGGVGVTNNGGFVTTNSGGFGTTNNEGWSLQNNGGSSAASSNEFNKVNYGGVGITNNGGFALTNSGGTSNSEGWSLLNNGGSSAASSNEFSKVNYGGVTNGGGWNLANRGGLDKASFGGLGTTKSGGMGVKNNGGLDIPNQGGWGTASDGGSRNVNTGGSATATSGGSGFVNNGGFSISNRGFRQGESGGLGSLNSGGMEVENNGGFSMSNHGGSSTANNGEWNLLNNGGVSTANNGVFSKVNHGGLGTVKSGGKYNGGLGTARSGGSGGVNNGGFTISIQRNGGSGAPNDGGLEVAYNGPDTTNSGKWNLPNHGGLNTATHGGFNIANNGGFNKANLGGLSSAGNGGFGPTNNGGFGTTNNGGFGPTNNGGFGTTNNGVFGTTSNGGLGRSNHVGLGAAIHGGWSEYGPCSTSCGGGTKTRSCSNPSPSHGGNHCTGSLTWSCNTQPCPTIQGGWSAWTSFSACTATCGPATKTRTRTCSHSPSYGGGSLCQGSHEETSYCDLISCGGGVGGKKLVRDKSAVPSTVEIQWPQPDQCLFGCKEKYLLVDYHEDGKKGVNPVMKVYVAKDQLHPPDEFSTSGHMELLHFGSVPFEEHDVEAMFYVLHPKGWKPTQKHFKTPELSEFVSAAAHTAVSVSAVFLAGAAIGSVVWPVGILAKAAVGGASAIFGMAATKIFDEVHETFLHCIGF